MRVVLISHDDRFGLAVAQGILDTQARLVALLKKKRKVKGLLGLGYSLGHGIMCSWLGAVIKLTPNQLFPFCRRNKIKYLRVPRVNDPQFGKILSELRPDIIVVSRFSEILPSEVISIPWLGILNIHCSLLPQLRGPEPIAAAIIGGFSESGVTIHYMDRGIDTGDIILQKRIPLEAAETNQTFHEKAALVMQPMIAEVMKMLLAGNVTRTKQDHSKASYFSIKKIFGSDDVYVDWSQPSRIIEAFVRAGITCLVSCKGAHFRVRKARIVPFWTSSKVQPGKIIVKTKTGLVVGTSDTPLEIAVSLVLRQRWWSRTNFRGSAEGSVIEVQRLFNRYPLSTLKEGDQLESGSWPNLNDVLTIP